MQEVKVDELTDYLFSFLETFDIDHEEKKLLTEYIEDVVSKLSVLYSLTEKDEGKIHIIKALEKLAEGENV